MFWSYGTAATFENCLQKRQIQHCKPMENSEVTTTFEEFIQPLVKGQYSGRLQANMQCALHI